LLTLVIGGARSGKSRYAQSLCTGHDVTFVATARPDGTEDWRDRIERHRRDRPGRWCTREEALDIPGVLRDLDGGETVLVDCITVWLSNVAYELRGLARIQRETQILERIRDLIAVSTDRTVILVSNEIGTGIVPANPVAREFRDTHGRANQRLAAAADCVVLITAGLPLILKGTDPAMRA
jgi:adenosylcobinamide kinase/adenosylcobinamide-phosphate guanylyltransferase